jgi:hypothetical protein
LAGRFFEKEDQVILKSAIVIEKGRLKGNFMTERELRKLEATIRMKMEEIKNQRVSLKDSGIGGLMNSLKKVDEASYEKIFPEYKKMVADYNIFK